MGNEVISKWETRVADRSIMIIIRLIIIIIRQRRVMADKNGYHTDDKRQMASEKIFTKLEQTSQQE